MARQTRDLIGLRLEATDGIVGKVKDVYFDDVDWSVRYFVVDTGSWLSSREVLISPFSVRGFDPDHGAIMTKLSRSDVEKSPPALSDAPVSRLYEERLHTHYGWPFYWGGTAFGGPGLYMYPPVGDLGLYPALYGQNQENDLAREERQALEQQLADANPHLKSCRDIRGYTIHAVDGEIGHVDDFILDDSAARLTHFVVDTRNWLPAKRVVVHTRFIDHIDWGLGEVTVNLPRETIRHAEPKSHIVSPPAPQKGPSSDLTTGSETLL